jgi:hypothetical protein
MSEDNKNKLRIYLDPKFDTLPEYYDRDIIKILTKNPKEVFIFWGVSFNTLNRILAFFDKPKEDLSYKMLVGYVDEHKHHVVTEILLKPFTSSYNLKFHQPVENLKIELLVYAHEKPTYSLLHSAHINMPSNKPSMIVDKGWLKRSWILEEGIQIEQEGEFILLNEFIKKEDIAYMSPLLVSKNLGEKTLVTETYIGSSGFTSQVGSSELSMKNTMDSQNN